MFAVIFFPNQRDIAGNRKLAALLSEQGIEVGQAQANFRACGNQYAEGAYIVQAAQPTYHLIRTLLDQHVPMDADFIKEQERLRARITCRIKSTMSPHGHYH